jgi:hypothetical protein
MKSMVFSLLLIFSSAAAAAQTFGQMAVSGALMGASGYFDGVAETTQFNYRGYQKIHPNTDPLWSDPKISWRNKWKNGDPNQGPAFLGSTSFLVGTTDLYHLMNTCRNASATGSAVVYALPQFRTRDNDWWQVVTKQKLERKPIWAYAAEFAWLTAWRGAGFTASYNWIYKGN